MIVAVKRAFYGLIAAVVLLAFLWYNHMLAWLYAAAGLVLVIVALRFWLRHRRYVPRNRVRSMRLRAYWRMRPGLGFASGFTIWWHFSRFAMFRKSKRIRHALSTWQRLTSPDEHSAKLGTAQRGQSIRIPYEEHALLEGPPRTGKSGLISAIILSHRGPVISTSTKPDMYSLTSGLRARQGPVFVFNPQGIGGIPSNVSWSVTQGCRDAQTAARRAEGFAAAVNVKGTDQDRFWAGQAAEFLTAVFAAADMVDGGDIRLARHWLMGKADQAEGILRAGGATEMAESVAQLRSPAEKTLATIKLLQNKALNFLQYHELARSVLPGPMEFDIPSFLASNGGTLYMIAAAGEDSPVAPVFAALCAEVHFQASMIGQSMPGERLDPPLRMCLDEAVNICPVPLPSWLSDSGGKGITIVTGCHSDSQLEGRWGADGAHTIIATSGTKIYFPGLSDKRMLETITALCGSFSQRARFQDHHSVHDVVDAAMARQIPDGWGLIVRGNNPPILAKLRRGWKVPQYKHAKRQGRAVAGLSAPAVESITIPQAALAAEDQGWLVSD